MPDPVNVPGDGAIDIPVSDPVLEEVMDLSPSFGTLLHNQLAQSGVIAQNNFITVGKAQDYDYLEGKRMVTLEEAIGVREVSSTQVPAGPTPRTS